MARITVEDCLEKIPNRFQLVLAATYRAHTRHTTKLLLLLTHNSFYQLITTKSIIQYLT